MRTIHKTYTDPLELIWIHAAAQLGMRLERSPEVNASWDGNGVLTIGTPETLDADDSLECASGRVFSADKLAGTTVLPFF